MYSTGTRTAVWMAPWPCLLPCHLRHRHSVAQQGFSSVSPGVSQGPRCLAAAPTQFTHLQLSDANKALPNIRGHREWSRAPTSMAVYLGKLWPSHTVYSLAHSSLVPPIPCLHSMGIRSG